MQTNQNTRRIKNEDRISSFPDCLLIEIISRLPCTEQAIRTGILSKRWKNLWTEVHNLIFIYGFNPILDHSEKRVSEFFSYIEEVLSRRGQLELNKFQLDIPYDFEIDKQVNNWIRYALSCNVKDLDLKLDGDYEPFQSGIVFDQFFFINSSVTRMKLDRCVFTPTVPTGAISWTNLKSLCIAWGDLDGDLIKNILSGSPLLETWILENCKGFCRIDVTSKSVKNLVVDGYKDDWCAEKIVEINAPHILSLTIKGELSEYLLKVVLQNVSSLVIAELDYCFEDFNMDLGEEEEEELLKGLILSLSHVKMLHIGSNCRQTLARLKAKGFTFPLHNDSSESEDWSDNDSTESEDWSDNDSSESEDE